MKRFGVAFLVLAVLAPAAAAQTAAASFTGKWEGTLITQRPDGTEGNPSPAQFNLTQNGKELTGTAGPPDQQAQMDKGAVNAGMATFEVRPPNGSVYKFTLTIVKERLQGEVIIERDGVVRAKGKIDAGKAK